MMLGRDQDLAYGYTHNKNRSYLLDHALDPAPNTTIYYLLSTLACQLSDEEIIIQNG
jgi:hypothetical protein